MKLLIRKPRYEEVNGRSRTIVKPAEFYVDESRSFSSDLGMITKEDFAMQRFEKHGTTYFVVPLTFADELALLPRRAQLIIGKDAGYILSEAGLHKDSIVLEAGSGSGGLTCFLAKRVKQIISYDVREEHQEVAKKNVAMLKLDNVTFKLGDVSEASESADAVILDLPNPNEALPKVIERVKLGGFIVVYTPTISQVMDVEQVVRDIEDLQLTKVVEVSETFWKVQGKAVRPKSEGIGHTAFLTFIRRLH